MVCPISRPSRLFSWVRSCGCVLPVPTSSGITLPPLECLFTVEEEVGLCGAMALDESIISGRTMLNLVRGARAAVWGCSVELDEKLEV